MDENGEIVRRAVDTVRDLYARAGRVAAKAAALPDEGGDLAGEAAGERKRDTLAGTAAALLAWAKKSEGSVKIDAMIKMARSLAGIPVSPGELDDHPWLLNVQNGTLDLQTGQVREASRADLLTKILPVSYEAEAACPAFTAFLSRILDGNEALCEFVRRALGYSLTGDISEQVLFVLHGTGQNGKSTLLETVRAVLGDGYAQQGDFSSFLQPDRGNDGVRNDLARLFGARLVSAVEADAGRRLSEVLIKQLTGGDRVTARFLFKEFFEYTPAFKLFLACNHKPVIAGTDYAIWRRIRLVPFAVTIPSEEQDRKLGAKLRKELPGILAWMVQGCLDWQREGLTEPAEVVEATRAYRDEMDILGGFIGERCVLGPRFKAASGDLYKAYTGYCETAGEEPIKQRTFALRLQERGLVNRRDSSSGRMWWHGIGLRADGELPPTGGKDAAPDSNPEGSEGSEGFSGNPSSRARMKGMYPKHPSDPSDPSVADGNGENGNDAPSPPSFDPRGYARPSNPLTTCTACGATIPGTKPDHCFGCRLKDGAS